MATILEPTRSARPHTGHQRQDLTALLQRVLTDLDDAGDLIQTWSTDHDAETLVNHRIAAEALEQALTALYHLRRRSADPASTLQIWPQEAAQGYVRIWWWRHALAELANTDTAIDLVDAPSGTTPVTTHTRCLHHPDIAAVVVVQHPNTIGALCRTCLDELIELDAEPGPIVLVHPATRPSLQPEIQAAFLAALSTTEHRETLLSPNTTTPDQHACIAPARSYDPQQWPHLHVCTEHGSISLWDQLARQPLETLTHTADQLRDNTDLPNKPSTDQIIAAVLAAYWDLATRPELDARHPAQWSTALNGASTLRLAFPEHFPPDHTPRPATLTADVPNTPDTADTSSAP
jgi:hypothetical protein